MTFLFLQGVQSFIEWDYPMPGDWDGGTVTAVFYWMSASGLTGSVVWGLQGRAYANGDPIDAAFGPPQEVTQANAGNEDVNQSGATPAITVAGSPAAGRHVQWRAYRLGSGADDLAATAQFLEARVSFGRV